MSAEPATIRITPLEMEWFEFRAWLRALSFVGFPIPIELSAKPLWDREKPITREPGLRLHIEMRVRSRDPIPLTPADRARPAHTIIGGDTISLSIDGPVISMADLTQRVGGQRGMKERVIAFVRDCVTHELLEWTKVNGQREFDPHDPEKRPNWQPF